MRFVYYFAIVFFTVACGESTSNDHLIRLADPQFESLPTAAYSNNSPSVPLTATVSTAISKQGTIEIVFTPLQALPGIASVELGYATPSGQAGGFRATFFPSSGELDFTLSQGLAGQVQAARIDVRKTWVVGRKTHLIYTWGPGTSGGQEIQGCQEGACDQPTLLTSSNTQVGSFTQVRFGETVSGTNLSTYATFHRLAIYNDRLTPGQVREAASNSGITPTFYAAALGDSITAFNDGYHAKLQQLLAPGTSTGAAVSNWGFSGDTAEMALDRLPQVFLVPQNAVFVLLGTNDVLNPSYSHTAAQTEVFLREIYYWVTSRGSTLCVLTTTPAVNTAFGSSWYTPAHLTEQTALNTWIASQSATVENAYSLFNTAANGTFCNYPTLNYCSYDGLHPRGLYTIAPSPAYPNGSDVLAESVWAAMGSPTY